jgi:uncharacterized lipoprotein YmbA
MSRSNYAALSYLLACSLMVACSSSPPQRYYTLQPVAVSTRTVVPGGAPANQIAVRVQPVVIPPEIDRVELVSRGGPYRVHIADSDRWAAPLDDQIRRTLHDDLGALLPAPLVADPNEPATQEPRRLLSVAVIEFYADDECGATLRADWTLHGPGAESQHGSEQFKTHDAVSCVAGTPAALPAAMSAALGTFSERLASVILAQPAPAPPTPDTATPH